MAGERICGRTECKESGKRADGANCDRVTIAELCERKANPRQEAIVHERLVSVTSAGAGENKTATIQSSPSPEFLNSLPFIKKFYPLQRRGEGKVTEVVHGNSNNFRQYEPQQPQSVVIQSDSYGIQSIANSTQLQGKKNNLTETAHASIPLGIFTSKSVSCWHSNANLHKKVAFTLAEVLITLGIIGVVAAVTLPTLVANYQKTVWVNQLKKTYTTLNEGYKQMAASEGCTTLRCADISEDWPITNFDFTKAKTKEKFVKTFKLENIYVGGVPSNSIYNYKIKYLSGDEDNFSVLGGSGVSSLVGTTSSGEIISFTNTLFGPLIVVDINGLKSPNTLGRDIWAFSGLDFNDTAMVEPIGSKKWIEAMAAEGGTGEISEEERIQQINDGCSKTQTEVDGNLYCTEKIIMDGWKMNY